MQISHFTFTNENYVAFELPSINSMIGVESLFAAEYIKFLKKYNELGHKTKVTTFAGPEDSSGYLPQHPLTMNSSTLPKCVVFNSKTHNRLSLNSLLD